MAVQDWDEKEYIAYYSSFHVDSEETGYRLTLSGYDNVRSSLADGLTIGGHANAAFTTIDRDNDAYSSADKSNCAEAFSGGII